MMKVLFPALLAIFFTIGCTELDTTEAPEIIGAVDYSTENLDEDAVRAFALEFEQDFQSLNVKGLDAKSDFRRMFEQAIVTLDLPNKERSDMLSEFTRQFSYSILTSELTNVEFHYELIKIEFQGDMAVAYYRMVYPDGGLNYHRFKIGKKENDFQIYDAYFYLTGETLAATFHELLVRNAISKGVMGNSLDDNFLQEMDAVKKVKAQCLEGNYLTAMAGWEALSEKTKKNLPVQLLKLQIASEIDDLAYSKALEEFSNDVSNPPQLALLDHYFYQEDWDKCEEAVRDLMSETGDIYLNLHLANIKFAQGDLDAAPALALKARPVHYYKENLDVGLIEYYLAAGNAKDAVTWMDTCLNYGFTKYDFEYYLEESHPQMFSTVEIQNWLNE